MTSSYLPFSRKSIIAPIVIKGAKGIFNFLISKFNTTFRVIRYKIAIILAEVIANNQFQIPNNTETDAESMASPRPIPPFVSNRIKNKNKKPTKIRIKICNKFELLIQELILTSISIAQFKAIGILSDLRSKIATIIRSNITIVDNVII